MRRQTVPNLPLELYSAIIQQVDNVPDLHRLLFVSRMFYQEALRRLYSCFDVRLERKKRHSRSLRALSQNPVIASQLRSLYLQTMGTFLRNPFAEDSSWVKILPQAFLSLENLKDLQLPCCHPACFIPPASVKFRLEELRFTIDPSTWPLESMMRFLENQDMIHTIKIDGGQWDVHGMLPPHYLPNLIRLNCVPNIARLLLPGRPIRFLSLDGSLESDWTIGKVESVEFLAVYDMEAFDECSACFPAVRYLQISAVRSTLRFPLIY